MGHSCLGGSVFGKGGPPRLGTQHSWLPAGHPPHPPHRPGATLRPTPPQARGHPSPPHRPGAGLPVCLLPGARGACARPSILRGPSPTGGVLPPPPPPSLLWVLLWRAPCRALDLYHIHLHGNPRKGAPHHRWKDETGRSKVIFQKGTQVPKAETQGQGLPAP